MTEPSYLSDTRAAYDTVAVDYAELLSGEMANQPFDRAMLATFAELVGAGTIADLGCGPGRVTAHLASLGATTFGIDLSPEMVAVARGMYPELRFDEGSITALDLKDGDLGGVVAWYSIIHTPPEVVPVVFAEFHRVLAPAGYLLLAFQVGDEQRHLEQAYGHKVSADAYRLPPERITAQLSDAGFAMVAKLVREPFGREKSQQAYLLARKPEVCRSAGQLVTDTGRFLAAHLQ